MKKNQYYNALKVLNIVKILLSIILFVLVISFAIVGHCASDQDYFPIYQNKNGHFSEELKANINNQFNSEDNYIFVFYRYYQANVGRHHYYVLYFPKNSNLMFYGEKYNNLYQFSLYKIGNASWWQGSFWTSNNSSTINGISGNGNTPNWWSGLESSNYNSGIDYVTNFTLYSNNDPETAQIVVFYDDGVTIPDGDTAREDMEKPQIGDYIPDWTNKPTFDSSSVENALQSVYNCVVWLGDNIKGTITGTGEYIADTMRWAIQKVLNTIRDVFNAVQGKINEVKNAVLTGVDKIQSTIDYISQPYDSTKVNTAFNNMSIKTDFNNMTTLVNNAFSVFDSTAEPNTFQIPIHLEGIPILHIETVQYIDLGWLYDCREGIRIFMWCITTFGLLYTIIDSLPSYLSGNDE